MGIETDKPSLRKGLVQLSPWHTSCQPFVPVTCKLLNELSKLSICAAQWIDY